MDVGRTKEYKLRLFDALEKDYRERIKANWNACDKGCTKEYTTLFESFYNLPEMKTIDLVSDSYFKEKKNEFIKQIHSFLENCKAPRKCKYPSTQINTSFKSSQGCSIILNCSSLGPKGSSIMK